MLRTTCLMLVFLFTAGCFGLHPRVSYDCPRTYEHSCDIYYQGKRIEECNRDPDGRLCHELKQIIQERKKADEEGRCYRDEDCIR